MYLLVCGPCEGNTYKGPPFPMITVQSEQGLHIAQYKRYDLHKDLTVYGFAKLSEQQIINRLENM